MKSVRAFSIILVAFVGLVAQAGQPCIPIDQLPFVITTEGTYCAVNDLTFFKPGPIGISIEADNVTVDLNGYAMRTSPNVASTAFESLPVSNVIIRNGRIDGFADGILLTGNSLSIHHLVINDAADGIVIQGNDVTIDDVVLRGRPNAGQGIHAWSGSRWEVSRVRIDGGFGTGIGIGTKLDQLLVRDSYVGADWHAAIVGGTKVTFRDSEFRSYGGSWQVVLCDLGSTSLLVGNTFSGGANTIYAIRNYGTGKYRDNTALGNLQYLGGTNLGGNN